MKKAERFFTEEEKEKIRSAVARAEAQSSGEIVPMVVDRSGHYSEFPMIGSVLLTFFAAVLLLTIRQKISAIQLLAVELLVFWLSFLAIRRSPRIWVWLIPDRLMEGVVRRRAEEAFYEHRLHETRDKTGVMILLSLLEKRVQLLADRGIHDKVSPEEWRRLVDQIARGMKKGQNCEAFCGAIEACGRLLALHFPKKGDDTNELPDEMVVEK